MIKPLHKKTKIYSKLMNINLLKLFHQTLNDKKKQSKSPVLVFNEKVKN